MRVVKRVSAPLKRSKASAAVSKASPTALSRLTSSHNYVMELAINPHMGRRGRERLARLQASGRVALAPLGATRENAYRESTGGAGGYARAEELRHTPVIGDTTRLFVKLTKGGKAMDVGRRLDMVEAVTFTRERFASQRRRASVPIRRTP